MNMLGLEDFDLIVNDAFQTLIDELDAIAKNNKNNKAEEEANEEADSATDDVDETTMQEESTKVNGEVPTMDDYINCKVEEDKAKKEPKDEKQHNKVSDKKTYRSLEDAINEITNKILEKYNTDKHNTDIFFEEYNSLKDALDDAVKILEKSRDNKSKDVNVDCTLEDYKSLKDAVYNAIKVVNDRLNEYHDKDDKKDEPAKLDSNPSVKKLSELCKEYNATHNTELTGLTSDIVNSMYLSLSRNDNLACSGANSIQFKVTDLNTRKKYYKLANELGHEFVTDAVACDLVNMHDFKCVDVEYRPDVAPYIKVTVYF